MRFTTDAEKAVAHAQLQLIAADVGYHAVNNKQNKALKILKEITGETYKFSEKKGAIELLNNLRTIGSM